MGKIPDRWLTYKPIGQRIEGTRFIAFKVPLRKHLNEDLDDSIRLDEDTLLRDIPDLGTIIDLTNTYKYYSPKYFAANGIEHKKIMIPGHQTPPKRLVDEFKLYVLRFLNLNKDNDKLIGVHCTHGVNRTGYLICNFMISEMTMKATDAIKKFNCARGHKIERENYIEALHNLTNKDYIPTALPEAPINSSTSKYDQYEYSNERSSRQQYRRPPREISSNDNGSPPRQRRRRSSTYDRQRYATSTERSQQQQQQQHRGYYDNRSSNYNRSNNDNYYYNNNNNSHRATGTRIAHNTNTSSNSHADNKYRKRKYTDNEEHYEERRYREQRTKTYENFDRSRDKNSEYRYNNKRRRQ